MSSNYTMVKLHRTIVKHRREILSTIEHGLSN